MLVWGLVIGGTAVATAIGIACRSLAPLSRMVRLADDLDGSIAPGRLPKQPELNAAENAAASLANLNTALQRRYAADTSQVDTSDDAVRR